MASYQPVSQNEVVAVINEDETFANDRDKSDAKTHHLELDRTGRHHLVSPQISTLVKTTIPANAAAATTPLGSVGKNGAGFNNYKPNNAVTFKLTDNDFIDKILPVKGLFFTIYCILSYPMVVLVIGHVLCWFKGTTAVRHMCGHNVTHEFTFRLTDDVNDFKSDR